MQKLPLLESHIGSISDALNLINEFCWNISINHHEERWFILGGEKVIFGADSREAIDTFLYGMALAYSVLPEECHENLLVSLGIGEDECAPTSNE